MHMGRRVYIVEFMDIVVMDRLLLRAPSSHSTDGLACRLCASPFHRSLPKRRCRFCAKAVCRPCTERLLIHGQCLTPHGLRYNPDHPLPATVCLACFQHTFAPHVVGFTERLPPSPTTKPVDSKDALDVILQHPQPHGHALRPLRKKVCVPTQARASPKESSKRVPLLDRGNASRQFSIATKF
ncbi:Aste57867_758 [Aphanomyces stellatus]|uniref:Aste57867_758 protein n=1 Tax=Aphanomyces stellatus TaxID=120398 RepID=A0A485K3R0_9STRA|nr:hypothetical protein As57867_000757 [Aphanomyces stellatus]VFT77982.1 Aste57867_758 [Aphanomyces stellatus]